MGYKKGACLIMTSIALFLTISFTNSENNRAAVFEKTYDTNRQKSSDEQKVKELCLDNQADWENNRVKIYWPPVQNASRYHVVCTRKSDLEIILEKNISAKKKTAFDHEFVYGEEYEYEAYAYEKKDGIETQLSYEKYSMKISPSPVRWDDEVEIKTNKSTTLVFYPSIEGFISPMGVQIYRGNDKEHMELVHTVKYGELSDFHPEKAIYYGAKQFVDKNKSHEDYYQIRTYIDVNGNRLYGEKSEIKSFREKGYRGEVKTSIKLKLKQPYIRNMEVTITNTGKLPIKVGMPYIKNYYKKDRFGENYVFLTYTRDDETYPYRSSNDLKIDQIEYKSQASRRYKILFEDATITIKPGKKMSLRFSRKNGKRFKNYFCHLDSVPWGEIDEISLYLFQYKGEEAFVRIFYQIRDGKIFFYSHLENDESGEPYYYSED